MTTTSVASMKEFRAHADAVRNWGRWGDDDQVGTLNLITDEKVRDAATLVRTGKIFSLGVELSLNGPLTPEVAIRWNPMHFVGVGGDYEQEAEHIRSMDDPRARMIAGLHDIGMTRITDDFVVMPLQSGAHWDCIAHVYYEKRLYNNHPSACITHYGSAHLGMEHVAPRGVTSRGVLLDVARSRNVDWIKPTDPVIEPEELDEVAQAQGVAIEGGDILLIRTGWWEEFLRDKAVGLACGGLSWRCAKWLHEHDVAAIAADNLAVENEQIQVEGLVFAMHCLCLRDMGLMFGEVWNLAQLSLACADDGVYEFFLSAPPLEVPGGLGSPLNPLAIK